MLKIQVIGNVGQDARVNAVNGRKSVNFSIAHNKKYKDSDGTEIESTFWVNCSYWKNDGQSTEIAKYLTTGTKVFVEGIPDVKLYKNKSGQMAASINCTVVNIELLSPKKEQQPANNPGQSEPDNDQHFDPTQMEDEIPW